MGRPRKARKRNRVEQLKLVQSETMNHFTENNHHHTSKHASNNVPTNLSRTNTSPESHPRVYAVSSIIKQQQHSAHLSNAVQLIPIVAF